MLTKQNFYRRNFELVSKIISFFLSKALDKQFFSVINDVLIDEKLRDVENNRTRLGIFSVDEFVKFIGVHNQISSFPTGLIPFVLKDLETYFLISKIFSSHKGSAYYLCNEKIAKFYGEESIIENLLFGFEYIISKYSNAVIKIENIDIQGNISIGTGFIINDKNGFLLVTNSHVLEKAHKLRIIDKNEKELIIDKIHRNKEKDIAIINLKDESHDIAFDLNPNPRMLGEIITMGYPSIPMTQAAYLACHKGEINSFVKDFKNNQLFLFSAKTSAGNSGSPIIDNSGKVVGIVTQELFEKNDFYEKGKLPYYAAIPIIDVVIELQKLPNDWN